MSLIKVDLAKVQAQKDAARIAELKQLLTETDHIVLPDYDKDKPEVLAQRQAWREEIRALGAK
jgi:hypothetical protein